MTDPLGRSQVLAYLEKLSSPAFTFSIISYEKEDLFRLYRSQINEICKRSNIDWYPLSYTKSPPIISTVYDLWQGWRLLKRLARVKSIDILHCRGYITAILGLRGRSRIGAKFIFDMRGFWADEKKESGHWSGLVYQPIYHYFKRLEKKFFKQSDAVISLTEVGKRYIVDQNWAEESKVSVIPTCVDFNLFPSFDITTRERIRKELGIDLNDIVFIYSGSLGGNYPVDHLLRIFQDCHSNYSNSWSLILTKADKQLVYEDPFWKDYLFKKRLIMLSSNIDQVHQYLMAADFGIIFYKEGFSNLGRAPTKLGEYLACGVTPVYQETVGDLEFYVNKNQELNSQLKKMGTQSDASEKMKLHSLALSNFGIKKGIKNYREIYSRLRDDKVNEPSIS